MIKILSREFTRQKTGQNFACVKDWDQEFYKKHGSFYFLATGGCALNHRGLMEVDYNGMGFHADQEGCL